MALKTSFIPFYSPQVRLDLDSRCNLKCDFCPTGVSNGKMGETFQLDKFEMSLKPLMSSSWGVYLSCAGEPLFHPKFDQAMEMVKKNLAGKDISIVTNASLLTEKKAKMILDSGVTRVIFSVDSLKKDVYEQIRKGAKLQRTIGNIERFMKMKGKRQFPKVILSGIIMQSTVDEMESLANFAIKIGADSFRLQHLYLYDDLNSTQNPVKMNKAIRNRLLKIYLRMIRNGILFEYPFEANFWKLFSVINGVRLFKNKIDYLKHSVNQIWAQFFSHCRLMGNDISVFADGSLYSCTEKANPPIDMKNLDKGRMKRLILFTRRRMHSQPYKTCMSCRFYKG